MHWSFGFQAGQHRHAATHFALCTLGWMKEDLRSESSYLSTTSGICIKSIKSCVFLLVMFFQVNSREAQEDVDLGEVFVQGLEMVTWWFEIRKKLNQFDWFIPIVFLPTCLKLRHRVWFDDASLLWSLVSFDLSRWQQVASHWTWDGPDLWGSGWLCVVHCQVYSWWWRLVFFFVCFSYDDFCCFFLFLWFLVGTKEAWLCGRDDEYYGLYFFLIVLMMRRLYFWICILLPGLNDCSTIFIRQDCIEPPENLAGGRERGKFNDLGEFFFTSNCLLKKIILTSSEGCLVFTSSFFVQENHINLKVGW